MIGFACWGPDVMADEEGPKTTNGIQLAQEITKVRMKQAATEPFLADLTDIIVLLG
jgi:hypothetical protein